MEQPPSRTHTTQSCISTDPNKLSDQPQTTPIPSASPVDYRADFRVYFDRLSHYLVEYLTRAPPDTRIIARQKLATLTTQQFYELSTDIYDELVRRQEGLIPFLPIEERFPPKRSQARQKFSTLPPTIFKDLSSDIHFNLMRHYPEFSEGYSGGYGEPTDSGDIHPISEPKGTNLNREHIAGRML